MLGIFKRIRALFFNYIDRIRVRKEQKLRILVEALGKKNPHLQLQALVGDEQKYDALDYALKQKVHPDTPHLQLQALVGDEQKKAHPKIWYNGDMLPIRDVIRNLVSKFYWKHFPNLSKSSEGDTVFHTVAQQRPDLLPDLLERLRISQFCWIMNMKNSEDDTVLYTVIQHEKIKVLSFFEKLSDQTLIDLLIEQQESYKVSQGGKISSKTSENTVLCTIASQRPGLLLNLLPRLFKESSKEQVTSLLFGEDENGRMVIDTIVENSLESSLKELFEKFSNEDLINLLSMQSKAPELAKDYGMSCNEDTVLHLIAQHKAKLLPDLLKKFSNEQLTNLLEIKNEKGDTLLHILAESNTELLLDLLIKDLPDEQAINLLSIKNNKDHTPLFYAVSYNESRDNLLQKYGLPNSNNPLDLVLEIMKKAKAESCVDLKPFINFLNIKCDKSLTLAHIILKEPYEDKWKEVVELIPNYTLLEALKTSNDIKILSCKSKTDVLFTRLGNEKYLEVFTKLSQITEEPVEILPQVVPLNSSLSKKSNTTIASSVSACFISDGTRTH